MGSGSGAATSTELGIPQTAGSPDPRPVSSHWPLPDCSLCSEPQLSFWLDPCGRSPSPPSALPYCSLHDSHSVRWAGQGGELAKHGAVCSPWWLGVTCVGEIQGGGRAGMPLGAYLLLEVEGPRAYFPQEPPSSSPYPWVTPLPEHPLSSWAQMPVLRTPRAQRRPGKPALTWACTEPLP